MTAQLGVLILHGIGTQDSDFAAPLIKKLQQRLKHLGVSQDAIAWQPVYWAPVLDQKQSNLWRDLSHGNDLDYVLLRKFVINALGDAVAYQRVPEAGRNNVYQAIHQTIHQSIETLRRQLGGDKPLMVLAHSLGCHMISNYIWDRQHGVDEQEYGGSAFERMETLAGISSFGCGIPLFMLAYDNIEPIVFPSLTLANYFPPGTPAQELAQATSWFNFYDPDDVFAYPLRPLSEKYRETVDQDIAINTGGFFTSWHPGSHTQYWTEKRLIRPVAEQIQGLLKLL